uniref:Uncharacterized protein n=1 Tax=Plectus sambesii TaxID=2011161 RepID=A0A914XGZ8_9BILA
MYRCLIFATLVALTYSQCIWTRTGIQLRTRGTCTTAACTEACRGDRQGLMFGTLNVANVACSTGPYSASCTCVFTSTKYTADTCPASHTDTTPCVDLMPLTWCRSTAIDMCTYSDASRQICRDSCECNVG